LSPSTDFKQNNLFNFKQKLVMNNHQSMNDRQDHGMGYKTRGCGSRFSKMFAAAQAGSFNGKGLWGNRKAANIEENETAFKISLYAAGLVKSNFTISVSNDVLTIAYQAVVTDATDKTHYAYQEYEPGDFERSFQLNGKVLTDQLSAAYTDGVLIVTLPKNPDTNKPAQQVEVR
jgi:HSP20 family protein